MAKHYKMPDLSNATPAGLADMLADAREKEAEAKFYAGAYRTALEARWPKEEGSETLVPTILGEKYAAERVSMSQERFDVTACREAAAAGDQLAIDALAKWCKSSPMVQIRTKEIAKKPEEIKPQATKLPRRA